MGGKRICELAKLACLLEAGAFPKPGNVGPGADFGNLEYDDFVKAALAIEPALEGAANGEAIGKSILQAVISTRKVCKSNVNLGIVLLLVPLAKAAGKETGRARGAALKPKDAGEITKRAKALVAKSSVQDAVDFVKAVRVAEPFLLPHKLDAREEKSEREMKKKKMTFAQLMKISSKNDMVAEELLNGFEKSLLAYKMLLEEREKAKNVNDAICQTYLRLLVRFEDTLVKRKFGEGAAESVGRGAGDALAFGGVHSARGLEEVLKFDRELRKGGVNPGSSADILCAGIFLALLFGGR